ncbi:MAG: hypothetical protein IRY91_09885 [Gemmatimonadaceae bacterium]|nr:hypothetical protein [Gemmatimonadaceae bacterium]
MPLRSITASDSYEKFRVNPKDRAPLVEFMESALRESGCTIIQKTPDGEAPFKLSFVTPWGERMGILAYAFLANQRLTRNRPADEHRFQLKYGSKPSGPGVEHLHELWQDPFGLYTTLLIGINPERGFFVGADPVLNSPTRFFISKEFKESQVAEIETRGWFAWAREQRPKRHSIDLETEVVETIVGGSADQFLRYVLFEREVVGEDQGHRQLVAEQFGSALLPRVRAQDDVRALPANIPVISAARLHALERELELGSEEILQLIARAPRLKMAVRGWVAERHLQNLLESLPEVAQVEPLEADAKPDFEVCMRGGKRRVLVECKNVLRTTDRFGRPRLDFQRTRAAQGDPCSRYYSPADFQVVAACLHAQTERWEFAARLTAEMAPHPRCSGKLANNVVIDEAWQRDLAAVLRAAAM